MNRSVGVIGLGLMGSAMAFRLMEAGYPVEVFNRTREKAEGLIEQGARWSENPMVSCDRVLISLYTTETVEEVLDSLAAGLRPGLILIDTTTGDPDRTAALGAKLTAGGVFYLDAPISGSSEQTRRGQVSTVVGGPREAFDTCRDLFDCLTERAVYAGPSGSGSKLKLVSNLVLGLNRAALAEGLAFARSLGLDPETTLDVLLHSMAYSRIMDTKARKMIDRDYRTQAKLSQHIKDVQLMIAAAGAAGLDLPLSEAHCRILEAAARAGYADADNSALIEAYNLSVSEPG
ncbi:NAD(P)-dependent oxidoreductase [Tautonia rosea]|uniref:NAD(P)-dependent oxidoreductase n=1 Tax=Tautonia rosea TaxID=2728037 RepID=UPI00147374B0|nr:NAD(P)-dependent oxidoreductase [Tautonia rosea]